MRASRASSTQGIRKSGPLRAAASYGDRRRRGSRYSPRSGANSTGPKQIGNLCTRALLQEAFADFSSLDIREHDDVIHEGDAHAGLSALIDLVGRK
jgi:hypothetical protein